MTRTEGAGGGAGADLVPTGRVEVTDDGRDLVLERSFDARVEDLWSSVAEPAGLAPWFGVLDGDPRPGGTVTLRLPAEEGEPVEEVNVLACDPPRSFSVDSGGWRLALSLVPSGPTTTLFLRHRLGPADDPGDIGPGWEFYLDRLAAARGGPAARPFEAYLEVLRPHYARS